MTERDIWMQRFGQNLYSLKPREMSISEFARRCSVSRSSMEDYIMGRTCPDAYTVIKIAFSLGRPVTDLIDYFY